MAQVDEKAMEARISEVVASSLMGKLQELIRSAMVEQTAQTQAQEEPMPLEQLQQTRPQNRDMQGLSLEAKHLRDFRKYDPRSFDGSLGDPTKAKMWLSSIETIFRFMRCPEEHKLQCTVFMLIGNVEIWWCSVEKMIDTGGKLTTWEQFKERFYEKYFSANTRYNKQAEFLNLKQGVMSMEKYEQEFDKLSHFTPELVATEAARTERFIQGLRSGLRGMVHALDLKTYVAVLRTAVRIDADSRWERMTGDRSGLGPPQVRKGKQTRRLLNLSKRNL
ncbi:uncharacterized protein LOC120074107 [Benincasa hispida]|uniref:uncharacterized protein LOC120074107 n=1 Tax=Benincasa hispida TaxID=102211 RepID=UPI001902B07A|nr:uncharacterized protein LOC120074107 [Benincasa hispida]XP_038883047.1 uncharacterized protein LOC120074107 [Benincasa hispida]XP_038883048.1 uncharacterized protein LOC120074107 [Benincasa hispida]XP_038883049.1 uncharacterized protein LOC120074107 [Benincasa hispida]XP_038883050.1 uncharacterized protein LOC120074107 [Benincasa hispida]XP_038883051.1 uncharacterized protein LOC120074107 [Benincasa hispida]XP_038883052.1 uncharacterized protein LOC120074107 [Benincasa hispida]XP_03888305